MEYNKNNVGIIGYWFATNYGGVASYYSLYTKIEKLGYSPFFIEDTNLHEDKRKKEAFSRKFFKEIGAAICDPYKKEELEKLNAYADTFLLGSDQVFTVFGLSKHGKAFLMEFANPDKKRIVVSGSCGGENIRKEGNEDLVSYAREELQKFSGVSVRESSGVDLVRDKFRVDATYLIDPIFFTSRDEFKRIGETAKLEKKEEYMLAYILDPTDDKREGIQKVSEILGLKKKIALDGRQFTHEENSKKLDLIEDTLPELDFKQWLHYYSNASFILTDSFHGMAMALILNIPFIVYINQKRGYQRFESLRKTFDVIDSRLIKNTSQITKKLVRQKINFKKINTVIEKETKKSEEWIKKYLSTPKAELNSIALPGKTVNELLSKKMCTGCGACLNICSCDAIRLCQDEWGYYRAKVEQEKCIDCGKCAKICPAIKSPVKLNKEQPECYEFIAKDSKTLMASSSGGAFSVFAREIFKRQGAVVGAAWRDDFSVEHIMIEDEKELPKLQKSKYLQSYTGMIHSQVKEHLNQGQVVLFTGCPCQVAGLKSYLGKEYDNLIAIDLLCGNAPSSQFFQRYLKESFPEGVNKYEFRNKLFGYNARTVKIELKNGKTIIHKEGKPPKEAGKTIIKEKNKETPIDAKNDAYQQVYHSHTMCATHCEKCKYQQIPRYGDLTIGDFWGLSSKDKEISVKKGASVILSNNEKGSSFLKSLSQDEIQVLKEVPLEWIGGNGYALEGKKNYCSDKRDEFYEAVKKMSFLEAVSYIVERDEKEESSNQTIKRIQNKKNIYKKVKKLIKRWMKK